MKRSDAVALAVLGCIALALFLIRVTGLPNLLDNEYRLGASVMDVVHNGNWICPRDALGRTDKPPMLTWLAALPTLALGRIDASTLYLPTALATLALAWIIYFTGSRFFGQLAGFLAGWAYLLSATGAVQMGTARWDGLFALTVAVTTLAGFHGWSTGHGWTWFWLAAAVSTLTKGPLGVLLAAMGFVALLWERRSGTAAPLRGRQGLGIVLFLSIVAGWFALAYVKRGPVLIDELIRHELISHAIEHRPGRRFFRPSADFLGNFAPWSLFTLLGLLQLWRTPATDPGVRRFERFVGCWFLGGLLIFSISPHNPARLLLPIVPPAALLAGRALAPWAARLPTRTAVISCSLLSIGALGFFLVLYHRIEGRRPQVQKTVALQGLAERITAAVGSDFALSHVDDPFALQILLQTMRPPISFEEAATALQGNAPAFVVVQNVARLDRARGPDAPAVYEVAGCAVRGRPYLHVFGNRPGFGRDYRPSIHSGGRGVP